MTTVVRVGRTGHLDSTQVVYIGRPSVWGNPYSHRGGTLARFRVATHDEAIEQFREYLAGKPWLIRRARRELKGKYLACWCHPAPCHGDVLARVAEGGDP